MKEKYKVVLQIILVFILIICALLFKVIPEYQASKGSSDSYIDTNNYTDIIEIKINNKPNFALVLTDKTISNIIFFDQESLCLYNQNIENSPIKAGTKKIIELLIQNDYLKQNCFLIITKYKTTTNTSVKNNFLKAIEDLKITITLQEESTTIAEKSKNLGIKTAGEVEQLKEIELLSKELVRRYKNNASGDSRLQKETVTEETSRDYTDTIYKKIETYIRENNIINQEVHSPSLEITKIPANNKGTIFPDETSWYYVQEGAVYAYISITLENKNYNYCYQSSIDVYKKGQC